MNHEEEDMKRDPKKMKEKAILERWEENQELACCDKNPREGVSKGC